MNIGLVYPLDKKHLSINKIKRYFHASTPTAIHMQYNGLTINKGCKDMTLTFVVNNSNI